MTYILYQRSRGRPAPSAVSVATPVATSLVIASQPSSTVEDTNFTVTVQIKDQFGANFAGTNSISVAKQSGTGTLSGTSPVSAVAGVATFSNLQMDTGSASVVLRFSGTGLGTVDTSAITITASGGTTPNKPGGLTTVVQGLDFSDAIPNPGGTGEYQIGSSEWTLIGGGDSWLAQTDSGSGVSPSGIWRVIYPEAGSYGDGQNRGSVGRPLSNVSEVYFRLRMKLSSNFVKHPISTKLIRCQISGGTFLFQLSHDNNWFRVSTEEGPGYDYDGFIVDGSAPPLGSWFTLEGYAKRGVGTGIVQVWVDGSIRTNATGVTVSPSGPFETISIDANYGGGGSTVSADQFMYLDDIYVATP